MMPKKADAKKRSQVSADALQSEGKNATKTKSSAKTLKADNGKLSFSLRGIPKKYHAAFLAPFSEEGIRAREEYTLEVFRMTYESHQQRKKA